MADQSLAPSPIAAGITGSLIAVTRTGRPALVPRTFKGQLVVIGGGAVLAGGLQAGATLGINKVNEKANGHPLFPWLGMGVLGGASWFFSKTLETKLPPLLHSFGIGFGALGLALGLSGSWLGAANLLRHDEGASRESTYGHYGMLAAPAVALAGMTAVSLFGGFRNGAHLVDTKAIVEMKDAWKVAKAEPHPFDPPVEQFGVTADSLSGLSEKARRFLLDAVPPASIARVMGDSPDIAVPYRFYGSLKDGATAAERVEHAMAAARAENVFEKVDTIMIGAPTGSGFVNWPVIQANEILSNGRSATFAIQYSKGSSFTSVNKLSIAKEQTKLLIQQIKAEIDKLPPGKRPKVYLYGESLGAWSSQEAVRELGGINGLKHLGIDRIIWAGTPRESRFMDEILNVEAKKAEVDRIAVKIGRIEDYEALPAEQRDKIQMVFLTHGNDIVPQLGLDILWRKPKALFGGHRADDVREEIEWLPVLSGLDVMIDEAFGPGLLNGKPWVSVGHDYRGTYPSITQAVFHPQHGGETLTKLQQELMRLEFRRVEGIT